MRDALYFAMIVERRRREEDERRARPVPTAVRLRRVFASALRRR